jgi:uncharacterized membrane protein
MRAHFRHHLRFYAAATFGVSVGASLAWASSPLATVAGGNAFFVAYLASAAWVASRATPQGLRKYAAYDDEGTRAIVVLTAGAIAIALTAILLLIRQDTPRDPLHIGMALAALPLGWLTIHTVTAFRYAHLYYAPASGGGDAGGLEFAGGAEPDAYDFLYHAFVIGMTGGVSDVAICSRPMRRLVMLHGVFSFFFNTTILALAVGAALG